MLGSRENQGIRTIDPSLRPLLDVTDEAERRQLVGVLIVREATPVISAILAKNRTNALRREELDDIAGTVTLRLVRRLQQANSHELEPIANLSDYVARLTYNAIYDVLRRKFPQRTRLKNRLRYVLTRDSRFVTWIASPGTVVSLRKWSERIDSIHNPALPRDRMTMEMLDRKDTGKALHAILTYFNKPVELDDLVHLLMELWSISDDADDTSPQLIMETTPHLDYENREHLSNLWTEIVELPSRQRVALLMNLRDSEGFNALALFALIGVATFDEIAAALEMRSEELTGIWQNMPFEDSTIASRLGITRQQVINLRKSARERLSRRMERRERRRP